jgi:hypothetical protein
MWLNDIWQKIKDFWLGTSEAKAPPLPAAVKKKFTVRSGMENRRTRKRFNINGERSVQTPTVQRKGRITITTEGRPRRCPQCGSKTTIIKAQSGNATWECSEAKEGCGMKW